MNKYIVKASHFFFYVMITSYRSSRNKIDVIIIYRCPPMQAFNFSGASLMSLDLLVDGVKNGDKV